MDYNLYWGDMHAQFKPQWCPTDWDDFIVRAFESCAGRLDFFPIVYYPAVYYETPEGLRVESLGPRPETEGEWQKIKHYVRKYHQPGELVTFPGYEWNGNRTRWGDHNVFSLEDDAPLDLSLHIDELYANCRARDALAIPHHTGYQVGERGKDWDHYGEDVSPFAEIFSVHGSSEACNTPDTMNPNTSMSPRVSGGTVQDGLARGHRLGIIASGDNGNGYPGKWGTGLVAVCAKELTRESLWEAFKARRVYGVTGDRIEVDFRLNDHFMGEVVHSSGPVTIDAEVVGSQALDRIELLRSNRVIHTHCHNGSWELPDGGEPVRAKMEIQLGWGPTSHYGLKAGPRTWNGTLSLPGGRIRSVEGCFTQCGQELSIVGEWECRFTVTTNARPAQGHGAGNPHQHFLVELEARPEEALLLECEGRRVQFSLRDAMRRSRVIPFYDEAKAAVKAQFGLDEDDFENAADVYYHNAHKLKLHHAIPEAGYRARFQFRDADLKPGRNWYYLRVTQLNGQRAWSSPIWVDNVA